MHVCLRHLLDFGRAETKRCSLRSRVEGDSSIRPRWSGRRDHRTISGLGGRPRLDEGSFVCCSFASHSRRGISGTFRHHSVERLNESRCPSRTYGCRSGSSGFGGDRGPSARPPCDKYGQCWNAGKNERPIHRLDVRRKCSRCRNDGYPLAPFRVERHLRCRGGVWCDCVFSPLDFRCAVEVPITRARC